jgi:motility quorum-sensing regulator / GCU-specific mRNA interferase toxin
VEKRKPHFSLEDVRRLVETDQCTLTVTARQTAHSIGFSDTDATEVVASLESKDFYKSMTDHYNRSAWQDVYKKKVKDFRLYIKLKITQVEGQSVLILSFKRDESVGEKS